MAVIQRKEGQQRDQLGNYFKFRLEMMIRTGYLKKKGSNYAYCVFQSLVLYTKYVCPIFISLLSGLMIGSHFLPFELRDVM